MRKFLLLLMTFTIFLSFSACGERNSGKKRKRNWMRFLPPWTGTLTKYTGSEISIETDEGQKLSFEDCSSTEVECINGIIPGQ